MQVFLVRVWRTILLGTMNHQFARSYLEKLWKNLTAAMSVFTHYEEVNYIIKCM